MQRTRILLVEAELSIRNVYRGEVAADAWSSPASSEGEPAHVILEIAGVGLSGTCLGKPFGAGLTLAVVLTGSDRLPGSSWSGRAFFLDGTRLDTVKSALHPLHAAEGYGESAEAAERSLEAPALQFA